MTDTPATESDIVVVGAGPAGLSAAAAAAERGRRVVLIDQAPRLGGQIWRHRGEMPIPSIARSLFQRVRASGVIVVSGAQVVDVDGPRVLLVHHHHAVRRYRTGAIVIATGARERFAPFPGWTLPGVLGVGGLQALIKTGLDVRGKRIVVAGSGPLLFPVAATAARAGADVRIVAEQAPMARVARFAVHLAGKPAALGLAWNYRRAFAKAPLVFDAWVTAAHGDERLRSVDVSMRGTVQRIECDLAAVDAGLVPNSELGQLLGCVCDDDAIRVDAVQQTDVTGVFAAGECTGVKGDAAAIAEGEIAGSAAAGDPDGARSRRLQRPRRSGRAFAAALRHAFAVRAELCDLATADTVICRCEDVRYGAIDPSWSQRQAKLWTRVGMGECQGAVCGPLCQALFGWQRNAPRPPIGSPPCGAWTAALRVQSVEDVPASAADSSR